MRTDLVTLIIIAAIPAIISAIVGFFNTYKLEIIRRDVNSKMDAFLRLARSAGFAEGVKHEKNEREKN